MEASIKNTNSSEKGAASNNIEDTIAAIATAQGEGGIGIIRISGEKSFEILTRIFCPISKKIERSRSMGQGVNEKDIFLPDRVSVTIGNPIVNRRLTYGEILDPKSGKKIDEVLAVFMKGPYTYTAEDVAEIHCHGSIVALRNVLHLCLREGARLAEPGEFTKRAFLNGRIDLSQAEAVIDLVRAKTEKGFDVALRQMEGGLSKKVREIRSLLMDLLVQVTVNLDYPDEDIEEMTYEALIESLSQINDRLNLLLDSAAVGKLVREGLSVAIVGRPNVGKSSLMNAFLKESRAIVTDIPGTTRDMIEERLNLFGFPIRLIDTAGIRNTEDPIEQIGIKKSKEAISSADLILFMVSGNEEFTAEDEEIIRHVDLSKTVILLNKRDLGSTLSLEEMKRKAPAAQVMEISVKEEKGLSQLENEIKDMFYGGQIKQENDLLLTNIRQEEFVRRAKEEIDTALEMADRKEALDFIEINVRQAFDDLGEILGETANDQILNEVFSRFCLGK